MVNNLPAMKESWIRSLGWEDPLEKWLPPPVFLLGKSHGQRSLAGYSPWGHKESDTNNWATNTHISAYKHDWFRRFSKHAAVASTLVAMWTPLGASCTSSTGSTKTKNKPLKNPWSCNFWKTCHFWPVLTYIQRTSLTAFVSFPFSFWLWSLDESLSSSFFKNWSIIVLHCCASFCCSAEWISLYVYIYSLFFGF